LSQIRQSAQENAKSKKRKAKTEQDVLQAEFAFGFSLFAKFSHP